MNWFAEKRIVVPYDFSELSTSALEAARGMVNTPAQIKVLFVAPHLSPTEPGVVWADLTEDALRERSRNKFFDEVDSERFADVEFSVKFGDPGKEIVEYAKEIKSDLIVMPSHGRSGLDRILIGSVAERVLRLAHCPVLILRGDKWKSGQAA